MPEITDHSTFEDEGSETTEEMTCAQRSDAFQTQFE